MTERIEQIRTAAQLVENALRLIGTEDAQKAADTIGEWMDTGEAVAEVVVKISKSPTATAMAAEVAMALRVALVAAGQAWAVPFVVAALPLVQLLLSVLAQKGPAVGRQVDVVVDLRP